jgi:hypothetical protein
VRPDLLQHRVLLVHYTPALRLSRSKVLLDAFRAEITNSEVETLDLCRDLPDLFTPERMETFSAKYILRTVPRD